MFALFHPKNLKGFSCRLERPRYMYFGPGREDWLSVSIRAHLGSSYVHPSPPSPPLVRPSSATPDLFCRRDINCGPLCFCFYAGCKLSSRSFAIARLCDESTASRTFFSPLAVLSSSTSEIEWPRFECCDRVLEVYRHVIVG